MAIRQTFFRKGGMIKLPWKNTSIGALVIAGGITLIGQAAPNSGPKPHVPVQGSKIASNAVGQNNKNGSVETAVAQDYNLRQINSLLQSWINTGQNQVTGLTLNANQLVTLIQKTKDQKLHSVQYLTNLMSNNIVKAESIIRSSPEPNATDAQMEAFNQSKPQAEANYIHSILGQTVAASFQVVEVEPTDDGGFMIVGKLGWHSTLVYNASERQGITQTNAEIAQIDTEFNSQPRDPNDPFTNGLLGPVSNTPPDSDERANLQEIEDKAFPPDHTIIIYTRDDSVMYWKRGEQHSAYGIVFGVADGIDNVDSSSYVPDYSGAYLQTVTGLLWLSGTIPQIPVEPTTQSALTAAKYIIHLKTGGELDASSYTLKGNVYQITVNGMVVGISTDQVTSISPVPTTKKP